MGTPQAIYELSRAYGETQSVIDRVCLKLDEMNIKPCELLEILNIKHSFCDGKSKGTKNDIELAEKYNVPLRIVEFLDKLIEAFPARFALSLIYNMRGD